MYYIAFHFHVVLWILKISFEFFVFHLWIIWESVVLFPSIWRFTCCLSVINFWFDFIMAREHMYMISFLLHLLNFMTQYMIYFGFCFMVNKRIYSFIGWSSINIISILLTDVFVQFFYFFTDFLSSGSINCWVEWWSP